MHLTRRRPRQSIRSDVADLPKCMEEGLINAGVYWINRNSFNQLNLPQKFSFEKDFLEKYLQILTMIGVQDNGYFIDIGIPEDFKKANEEIKLKYDA